MPDKEKVIEALHCRAYNDDFPCWKCAYYKQDEKPIARCDYRGLMDDAITLLKEQERIVGRWISIPYKKARICNICQADEPYKFAHDDADVYEYCPHCGAKMEGL